MSVFTRLKTSYGDLKPMQRIIADYFLGTDFESLNASIEEVAKKSGTSVASVSRFCKMLGYESFQHFKMSLSRDIKYEPKQVIPDFNTEDDPELVIRKVFSEAVFNLQATEGAVDFAGMRTAAEHIIKSRVIYFYGLGGSGKAGAIGEEWFSHIGYTARSLSDAYEMLVTAEHAGSRYTVIALSHSGLTAPVVNAANIARSHGACIVGVTNYRNSPLAEVADVLLLTACPERGVHVVRSNSIVAQSTILRALYMLAAVRSKRGVEQSVGRIEDHVSTLLRKTKL
jgi:DNA-binding MurR/RpiR family transcriptional regulator